MNIPYRPIALACIARLFSGLVLNRAQAGGGHYYAPVVDPVVKEECGSCHLAFAPAMLPASSWRRMIADHGNHFGDDASVDADTAARNTRYRVDNAADTGGQRFNDKLMRGVTMNNAPLRITELPRWQREHREVPDWEWRHKEVRSKANCVACHAGAERGYYDD
jgi:hypothetical protein